MSSFKINSFDISTMQGTNNKAVFNAGKIGNINVDPNLPANVVDGDVLTYSSSLNEWIPQAGGGGSVGPTGATGPTGVTGPTGPTGPGLTRVSQFVGPDEVVSFNGLSFMYKSSIDRWQWSYSATGYVNYMSINNTNGNIQNFVEITPTLEPIGNFSVANDFNNQINMILEDNTSFRANLIWSYTGAYGGTNPLSPVVFISIEQLYP